MNRDEAIAALNAIKGKLDEERLYDMENAHMEADEILIKFLRALGHNDVADAWEGIEGKWYA